uniref:RadC-like JAB domain-containing protein n=1 Tax=Clostridium argentinense TaxID=29341 RepID=A0A7I6N153_9CLOT|nr:hypothetical protein [Clostridium argentinense]
MILLLIIKKPKKDLYIRDKKHIAGLALSAFSHLKTHDKEVLICCFIDENNKLIEIDLCAEGTKDEVSYPRIELIKRCMALGADKIAIYHTHPYKNSLIYSSSDYETFNICNMYCKEFGIQLIEDGILDFTRNTFLSIDNNIYTCNIEKLNLKTIKNEFFYTLRTIFLTRHKVNSIIPLMHIK